MQILDAYGVLLGLGAGIVILVLLAIVTLMVLAVLVVVQAYKAGRSGWWIYLIAMFICPLNLVAIIGWFAHWKDHPMKIGGLEI